MTTLWGTGAALPGYDDRLTLSAFLYDSARQADWQLRDRSVHVLPDAGLKRFIDNTSPAWVVPTVHGADAVWLGDEGEVVVNGLEVLWEVYTANSGAAGTALGDFPAAHHADIVAGVLSLALGSNIYAVSPATSLAYSPPVLRGIYQGVNSFARVDSDTPGYIKSVVSSDAVAYVRDELAEDLSAASLVAPVDYVGLGVSDGSYPVVYRWYDMSARAWIDGQPPD